MTGISCEASQSEDNVMTRMLLPVFVLLVVAGVVRAEVKTKTVEYKAGDVQCKGFLAWDDAIKGTRPGVLVVHEFWGLNDYARKRAEQLAKLGYVAFAADMYGAGQVTKHPKEAAKMAGMVRKNEKEWVARALAGLKVLRDNKMVDPDRVAAIGYCFGGSTVLQLAYHAAPVKAVVSFHGALPVPTEEQAKDIKAHKIKILICHGGADKFIPEKTVNEVRDALEKAGVNAQIVTYPNATHSFTVPTAAESGLGTRYDPEADRRSWQEMQTLFQEVLGKGKRKQ
jgi:dienelactone hydrolase